MGAWKWECFHTVECCRWMEQQQQKRDRPVRCVCEEIPAAEHQKSAEPEVWPAASPEVASEATAWRRYDPGSGRRLWPGCSGCTVVCQKSPPVHHSTAHCSSPAWNRRCCTRLSERRRQSVDCARGAGCMWKLQAFVCEERPALVWELSLTASWPSVSMSRHVSSSALLLSHEAASYSQKVTDNRISQDSCSDAHCKPTRLLQQCLSSDQCWRSTSSAVSPECRCSTHHAEAEIWTHYSDTSWRLTLAAYLSANNVEAVYHCPQVSTWGSSILSDRYVCSGCWQHWLSLSSFSSTWRSDGAQNENDNGTITELCSLRTMYLEWFATDFAFIIHHTRTVPKQTKDNTISLGLRDMSWCFRDCLGR